VDCTSPPGWLVADVMLAPGIDTPGSAAPEELTVVAVAAGDSPGGYCVPVLTPLGPVKMGRSIG
jgi:hypothetical protein